MNGSKVTPATPKTPEFVTEKDLDICYLSYALAIVLHAPDSSNLSYKYPQLIVKTLMAKGIRVAILNTTEETQKYIVILVDAFDDGEQQRPRNRLSKLDQHNSPPSSENEADGRRRRMSTVIGTEMLSAQKRFFRTIGGFNSISETVTRLPIIRRISSNDPTATKKKKNSAVEDPSVITSSEELALLYRAIEGALFEINLDEQGRKVEFHVIRHDSQTELEKAVHDIFPLHDEVWNDKFLNLLFQTKKSCPNMSSSQRALSWLLQRTNFWYIDHIRKQFGDRVFTYFQFLLFYTRWVQTLAICCGFFYFTVRFASWSYYVTGMGIIGYLVAAVWGPLLTRFWERKSKVLAFHTTFNHVLMPPKFIPNPYISRKMKDSSWAYRANVRMRVSWLTILSVLVNVWILLVMCVVFIQWYVYGKMAPTCDCCEFLLSSGIGNQSVPIDAVDPATIPDSCDWLLTHSQDLIFESAPKRCELWRTCFLSKGSGLFSDRWVYILFQGICLGLVLDVGQSQLFKRFTEWLTKLEGWETLEMHNRHLTRKQFFFTWINMFAWFLILAFFYVPFGSSIQRYLTELGYSFMVPPWGWRYGVVSLDEAFVTPMIVTALLNFLIDTFIPTLLTKAAVRVRKARKELQKLSVLKKLQAVEAVAKDRAQKLAAQAEKQVAGTLQHLKTHRIPSPSHGVKRSHEERSGEEDVRDDDKPNAPTKLKSLSPESQTEDLGSPTDFDRCENTNGGDSIVWFEGVSVDHGAKLYKSCTEQTPQKYLELFHVTPDENSLDATEIVAQMKLPEFNENRELVETALQFGYISMFTVCWALLPTAAAGKLLFEFRGDVYRLLFASKRRIPMATQLNIGEIQNSLMITSFLAIAAVSIMSVLSTGGLDFGVNIVGLDDSCKGAAANQSSLSFAEQALEGLELSSMRPDFDGCRGTLSWGVRVTFALFMEHLGLALFLLVISQLPGTPPYLNDLREQQKQKAAHNQLRKVRRVSEAAKHLGEALKHNLNPLHEEKTTPDQVQDMFSRAVGKEEE